MALGGVGLGTGWENGESHRLRSVGVWRRGNGFLSLFEDGLVNGRRASARTRIPRGLGKIGEAD